MQIDTSMGSNKTQRTSSTKFLVLDLLTKASSANISQQDRKNTDEQLKQLGIVDMRQHIADLSEIIGTPDIPESNPSKDHAAIYMKNYLRSALASEKGDKVKAGTQTVLSEDL